MVLSFTTESTGKYNHDLRTIILHEVKRFQISANLAQINGHSHSSAVILSLSQVNQGILANAFC